MDIKQMHVNDPGSTLILVVNGLLLNYILSYLPFMWPELVAWVIKPAFLALVVYVVTAACKNLHTRWKAQRRIGSGENERENG